MYYKTDQRVHKRVTRFEWATAEFFSRGGGANSRMLFPSKSWRPF